MDSRDLYQNTPLHYLASYRKFNIDALELLIETPEGQEVWMKAQNEWGYIEHMDLITSITAFVDRATRHTSAAVSTGS